MKIIKSFDKNIKRTNFDCRIKALQKLMEHYGVDVSLYTTMVLSESITFRYGKIDFEGFPVQDVPFAFATRPDVEEKFFNTLGLIPTVEKIDDSSAGWECIKSLIDEDTPILIKIDGNFVNRLSSSKKPDRQGIKVGHLSTLLLVGYSEEKDGSYVALTEFTEGGCMIPFELERVQKARNSICFPLSPNFECIYLKKPIESEKINHLIMKKSMLSLKKMSKSMIDPASFENDFIDDIVEDGFNYKNIRNGIIAMEALYKDLQDLLSSGCTESEKFNKPLILLAQLLRSNLSLGSSSAFRYELGECLKELGEHFNLEELNLVGNEFSSLSLNWKKFIFQLRATAKEPNSRACLQDAIKIFRGIIDNEKVLFNRLSSFLSEF